MITPSLHTLVNFRASTPLLESFDRVCQLSGKTRTRLLSEMMRHRVSTVGARLPAKLTNERLIDERLKIAVEGSNASDSLGRPGEWLFGGNHSLPKFSDF